ncbi:MAG: FAD-dependent oxidoreductase, partial [Actinomycetota bacterium]|nr:FAD-dependent oxidoreductase [Actinomycetota bacterium]
MYDYDLLVIGSGPGGQKAAIAGAKMDRRTAIVEKKHMVGGVCINTGTIPSKTMREAILYLTGLNQRELYGHSYRLKEDINVADLTARTQHVIGREIDVIRSQLGRNHVALIPGTARFLDDHTVAVTAEDGSDRKVTSERFVIAVGTRPARPDTVEFDGAKIVDSDQILELDHIPPSMVVVGAGVIGIEYASMFAALGTKVTVVERRDRMLEFCDLEIVEALKYQLRDLAVTFRFRETVASVSRHGAGTLTELESGKKIPADTVMYSAGRQGVTEALELGNAGLEADNRGRISVNDDYLTSVPHIYAVGDVIG